MIAFVLSWLPFFPFSFPFFLRCRCPSFYCAKMPCFTCNDSPAITRFMSASFRCLLKQEVISVRFPSELKLKLIGYIFFFVSRTVCEHALSIYLFPDDRTKQALAGQQQVSDTLVAQRPETLMMSHVNPDPFLFYFQHRLRDSTFVFASRTSSGHSFTATS